MIVLYIDQYYVFIKCPLQKTPVTAFSPYQGTTTGQPCHLLHMPTCYHWLSLDLDPIPGEEHGLKIQGLLAVLGFMSDVAASWKFNWSEKKPSTFNNADTYVFPSKMSLDCFFIIAESKSWNFFPNNTVGVLSPAESQWLKMVVYNAQIAKRWMDEKCKIKTNKRKMELGKDRK